MGIQKRPLSLEVTKLLAGTSSETKRLLKKTYILGLGFCGVLFCFVFSFFSVGTCGCLQGWEKETRVSEVPGRTEAGTGCQVGRDVQCPRTRTALRNSRIVPYPSWPFGQIFNFGSNGLGVPFPQRS